MSRLIVKNLPKDLTEEKFREHFAKKGEVTDAKLMRTQYGSSRRFGFIGYRTEKAAYAAMKHFNDTYINMSKITVEKAIPYGSEALPRPWSRYTEGSSANERMTGATSNKGEQFAVEETDAFRERQNKKDEFINSLRPEDKDSKLKEYLQVMTSRTKSKTWANDDVNANETSVKAKVKTAAVANRKTGGAGQLLTKTHVTFEDSDDELYEDLPAQKPKDTTDNDGDSEEEEEAEVEDEEMAEAGTEEDEEIGAVTDMETNNGLDQEPSEENAENKDTPIPEKKEEVISDPKMLIEDTGRLFVRNLSYACTEKDLKTLFSKYGPLSEVHMPIAKDTKRSKGYAYILFLMPEHAVKAFEDLDMKTFQGRLLHIIPAKEKPQPREDELLGPNGTKLSSVKKEKEKKRKDLAASDFNWNSLYMSSDAIAASIADRLGVEKSDVLNADANNMAVRLALAETQIVTETKEFFEKNGIILENFGKKERSDTVILVKNIPFGTSEDELRQLFGKFGELGRVLIPPARTMAVVEFLEPTEGRTAFKALAYRRFKDTLIYLEKAPTGVFRDKFDRDLLKKKETEETPKIRSGVDLIDTAKEDEDLSDVSTLFVKNLNFASTPEDLRRVFASLEGYRSSRINVKPDPKHPGKTLSMGFGFVEFSTKDNAEKALKAMQGYMLDGHALELKFSHHKSDTGKAGAQKAEGTKLVVRNVPFEATSKDLRELFGTYGQLKSLRLPKKFNGGHRGFAFL
ncbi:uncharacterized protein BYT42DRAFT_560822, partial [Radiomyces spectabilis]|uniref:uncharacterized protein n=1 Tax=Radiomyces spectabilis TaxID=64574 RepID=UPI0022205177